MDLLQSIASFIGIDEFRPTNEFINKISVKLCSNDIIAKLLCSNVMFITCGYNSKELNMTLLPIILEFSPAGLSIFQLIHYGQEFNSGEFRKYDYGESENLIRYNAQTPPNYKLERITAPLYLMYSYNDWMSDETDVLRLSERLPNVKTKYLMPDECWNHLDYIFAIHANIMVNDKIIKWMNSYD